MHYYMIRTHLNDSEHTFTQYVKSEEGRDDFSKFVAETIDKKILIIDGKVFSRVIPVASISYVSVLEVREEQYLHGQEEA